jgi:hypothetical protein
MIELAFSLIYHCEQIDPRALNPGAVTALSQGAVINSTRESSTLKEVFSIGSTKNIFNSLSNFCFRKDF